MMSEVDDPANATHDEVPPSAEPQARSRRRFDPSLTTLMMVGFLAVGLRVGLRPLGDNSFLTHLATGRLIVDSGSVPSSDPYSFTASGDPWTVQSWGASVLYAGTESLGGLALLRAMIALVTVSLTLAVWHLTSAAQGLVARLAVCTFVISIGTSFWSERPLLFGLLGLALVMLAGEGKLDPRWLVPVMWVWVNTHGSFPFGLAVLVLLAAGRRLDGESPTVELRATAWCALGTALGALNPIGPKLLTFPLNLLEKRESFARIVEWKAPTWEPWSQRLFAIQLVVALVLLVWRARSWRLALPLVAFGLAAVTSVRNVPQASLVLAPLMAAGLAGVGSLDGRARNAVARVGVVALGALSVLLLAVGLTGPHTDLAPYPVDQVAWMRDEGLLDLESRVVTRDFVGNYLEALHGPDEVRVFIDDRVDMYPQDVVEDYATLLGDEPPGTYAEILARYEPTAVLWNRDSTFAEWIENDPAWRVVNQDDDWVVVVPAQ